MARKPRSKFAVGDVVTLRKWQSTIIETGVVAAVIPSFHEYNDTTITSYRYRVQMQNAFGVFGASMRFVWESELKKSLIKPIKTVEVKPTEKDAAA